MSVSGIEDFAFVTYYAPGLTKSKPLGKENEFY
jgi:hypothetical protein